MISPKLYAMRPKDLDDFVHNMAKAGDIATTYDEQTRKRFMYFCTEENIGKDVDPHWEMVDEKEIWKYYFNHMSLEEKVDFLIDKYIQDNI